VCTAAAQTLAEKRGAVNDGEEGGVVRVGGGRSAVQLTYSAALAVVFAKRFGGKKLQLGERR
jgi:hypothetical protein